MNRVRIWKRTRQHDIEEAAYRQFEACMPAHWVIRSQLNDYGIDREVEVFTPTSNGTAGHSTAGILKVQMKGTERPNTTHCSLVG